MTSKIKLSIFQSEPSVANLNKVLESVLLTPYCPFHLSGNMFKLLTDIFLFYDFSVKGFVEGFKVSGTYDNCFINWLIHPLFYLLVCPFGTLLPWPDIRAMQCH